MRKIEYILVAGKRYAIVPFSVLDSFSRSYDNFFGFARSKGFKDLSEEGGEEETEKECWEVLSSLRTNYPHILRIAIGNLPQFIGETDYRYRLIIFPNADPRSEPEAIEADISDMVHDEPEFDNAVCVFRA